ncbi:vitamin B6 biosynthesis protein [Hyphopichia burtonii NRRL Y-1933]|uniref:pyridoxal 5'-phosphate synthase (glutamine hydrolyzing) n=1 Tax=Hyphopichia burtonii NRRL Y-1933 TaxID=984485 RepID=A0A1E4RDX0_9ASCO|nr:vitamin B6 biosynthesis protein [Hyphopichia burtonii NRRL Y-1933]ODV65433.1 vitamin B6 biosynthesis protein [Hyphopichia burtonii NRRL Y-1933]
MTSTYNINKNLAQMLKGGVIMDVTNVEEAVIAEKAGAVAVMALEKIPSDMRKSGQVCRMSDPKMIKDIMNAVSIPVMAKVRIGHLIEAQLLESLGIDYIDESEVLTPADRTYHIDKTQYKVPFVCGAKDLGEALRRINEGAAMLRTKGEAGTGDISEAVKHIRQIKGEIDLILANKTDTNFLTDKAIEYRIPVKLLEDLIEKNGKFPVVNFAAGGVATPADAALCMKLGMEGVFVGSGIFRSSNPEKLAKAIVNATTHYDDPAKVLEYSTDLGEMMPGVSVSGLQLQDRLSTRGW